MSKSHVLSLVDCSNANFDGALSEYMQHVMNQQINILSELNDLLSCMPASSKNPPRIQLLASHLINASFKLKIPLSNTLQISEYVKELSIINPASIADYHPFSECCSNFYSNVNPRIGAEILYSVLTKIDAKKLSPVHAYFTKLCLHAKLYNLGWSIVKNDVLEINTELKPSPKEALLYFYYAGMICTGLNQYEKALYYYHQCVSYPGSVMSKISIEAAKKYLLLSAILRKSNIKFSFLSRKFERLLDQKLSQYHELLILKSAQDLRANQQLMLEQDKNMGLFLLYLDTKRENSIQELTKTFKTLSLQDIGKKAGIASDQELIQILEKMILTGKINAKLDMQNKIVEFGEEDVDLSIDLVGDVSAILERLHPLFVSKIKEKQTLHQMDIST